MKLTKREARALLYRLLDEVIDRRYQAADRALLFGSAVHRAVVMPMAL